MVVPVELQENTGRENQCEGGHALAIGGQLQLLETSNVKFSVFHTYLNNNIVPINHFHH